MKKIIVIVLLLLCVNCTIFANANTTKVEEDVQKLAISLDNITDAKCIVHHRICVVAVKTEKVVTKSQYENLKKKLEEEITKNYQIDAVIVTRNVKIFKQIEELNKLEDNERAMEIEKILQKLDKNTLEEILPSRTQIVDALR